MRFAGNAVKPPWRVIALLMVSGLLFATPAGCDRLGLLRPPELDWPPEIQSIEFHLESHTVGCRLVVEWSASVAETPDQSPQCRARLDHGRWTDWSSAQTAHFDNPVDGAPVVEIQARNVAGKTTAETRGVDVACAGGPDPPSVTMADPEFSCYAGIATVRASCSATDDETPQDRLRYRWFLDGEAVSDGWNSDADHSWHQVENGTHTIRVDVQDEGGRIGSADCELLVECECDGPKFLFVTPDISCEEGYIKGEISWAAEDETTPTDHIIYKYRIVPRDSTWHDHPGPSLTVSLPDGTYTFYLWAIDEDGCHTEATRNLSCP